MINEKLGVPDGLKELSKKIYDDIIERLSKMDPNIHSDNLINLGKFDVFIPNMINIKNFPFNISIVKDDGFKDGVEFLSANLSNRTNVEFDKRLYLSDDNTDSSINFVFIVSDDSTWSDVVESFNKDLDPSILSHELKHLIDSNLSNKTIMRASEYSTFSTPPWMPKIMREFNYLLYFTSTAENLVRTSEAYSKMIDSGVNKSNFLDFLKDYEMIKNLNTGINLTLDKFIQDLNSDSEVEEFLKEASKRGFDRTSSNALDALEILRINLYNEILSKSKEFIDSYIRNNSIRFLFDEEFQIEVMANSTKEFVNIKRKLSVFKTTEKYFEFLIKRINLASRKTKTKIIKLYDMLEDDKKSIKNWDLHIKINSKKNEMKYTLNFDDFKLVKK